MKKIVCYGDSNTAGEKPGGADIYPFENRWTRVLQKELGQDFLIVEEGLSGRTVIADEEKTWRRGYPYFEGCVMSHSPADLFIIMLGTNDLKDKFYKSAEEIAEGLEKYVSLIKKINQEESLNQKILLIVPTIISFSKIEKDWGFSLSSEEKSKRLVECIRNESQKLKTFFLNSNDFIKVSEKDGVHFDEESHLEFGARLSKFVKELTSN